MVSALIYIDKLSDNSSFAVLGQLGEHVESHEAQSRIYIGGEIANT
jgi:hypothetical protein